MPIGANMAIRRTALARVGGLCECLGKLEGSLRTGEDHEFFLRLLADGCHGMYEPTAVVHHLVPAARLHEGYFYRWLYQNGRDIAQLRHSYPPAVRTLAGVEATRGEPPLRQNTRIRFRADFAGTPERLTNVLSIVREGLSNIVRHANARTATIDIQSQDGSVRMHISDDGVGYRGQKAPWSIDSRVRESGGQIRIGHPTAGTDLQITLPQQ